MAQIISTADGRSFIIDDEGVAHEIGAAQSAPASATVAEAYVSPFAVLIDGKAATDRWPSPLQEYANAAPNGKRQQVVRQAAAWHRVAGYACNAETVTMTLGDETKQTGHGFADPRESGTPCPTTKAECKGTIL